MVQSWAAAHKAAASTLSRKNQKPRVMVQKLRDVIHGWNTTIVQARDSYTISLQKCSNNFTPFERSLKAECNTHWFCVHVMYGTKVMTVHLTNNYYVESPQVSIVSEVKVWKGTKH